MGLNESVALNFTVQKLMRINSDSEKPDEGESGLKFVWL